MARAVRILALLNLLGAAAFAQSDPEFLGIPFDNWVAHADAGPIHWTVRVDDPVLTYHQRIASETLLRVDGGDLIKRRSDGRFILYVQITDSRGIAWQNHEFIDISRMGDGLKGNEIQYLQPFFILPGDYRMTFAVYDPASGEHGVMKRRLHVPALHTEPLRDAWRDLPAVEYVASEESPDDNYLPRIDGRLALRAASQVKSVDLIVNLTPSEHLAGSKKIQNQVFAALLPSVKILSQVDWGHAPMNIEMVDLARVETVFRQENAQILDWEKARAGLIGARPIMIDVKALEKRRFAADFFVKEVQNAISEAKQSQVVIVMSRPVVFEPGVDLNPIKLGVRSGLRVFYLRFQPPPRPLVPPQSGMPSRGSFGPMRDELAPLLRDLNPTLIDIHTPDQFRKALAGILNDARTR